MIMIMIKITDSTMMKSERYSLETTIYHYFLKV